jgi:hypothetical protein
MSHPNRIKRFVIAVAAAALAGVPVCAGFGAASALLAGVPVFAGFGAASASAAPACYAVFLYKRGNYSARGCATKVANLTGEYVLAEPLVARGGRVWCALLTEATGEYNTTGNCANSANNGLQTRIVLGGKGEIEVLPEAGTKAWTGSSGETSFEKSSGEKVTCKEASAEGADEGGSLGLAHVTYKKCSAGGGLVTCTGLGEASGVILLLPSWHLVYDTLKASLGEAGIAIQFFLNGSVHFECAGKLMLFSSGGMSLCLIASPKSLTKTFEYHCKASKGKPEDAEYYDAEDNKVAIAPLESSENEGKAEEVAEITSGTLTYSEAILLMY